MGLGVFREGVGCFESTLAWKNHMTAIAERDACEQQVVRCMGGGGGGCV